MRRRRLGTCGLRVSEVALGTMTWGRDTDEHEAREQFDVYLEAGGTLVDTSDVYGDGASQEIVGQLLHHAGFDDVLVLSRSGGVRSGDRDYDHSRRHLRASLDASLRRLGVDAIDVWSIHGRDPATPLDEVCDTMAEAVAQGKAHYLCVTDWPGPWIGYAASRLGGLLVCGQYEYSLLERGVEADVTGFASEVGIGIIGWSPLGRGVLTGKYRRGTPADSRGASSHLRSFVEPYLDLPSRKVVDAACAAADGLTCAPLDVALAWVLRRPGVVSTVVGARTAAQLRGVIGGLGTDLPQEIDVALSEISAPISQYPSSEAGERYVGQT